MAEGQKKEVALGFVCRSEEALVDKTASCDGLRAELDRLRQSMSQHQDLNAKENTKVSHIGIV